MKRNESAWPGIEARLRRDSAAEPMPANLPQRALRAVRVARASAAERAPAFPVWRWAGALGAFAAAAWLVGRLPEGAGPDPAPGRGDAGWSLASVDAAALAPLQREWEGLRSDLSAAAAFVGACLPSAPPRG